MCVDNVDTHEKEVIWKEIQRPRRTSFLRKSDPPRIAE